MKINLQALNHQKKSLNGENGLWPAAAALLLEPGAKEMASVLPDIINGKRRCFLLRNKAHCSLLGTAENFVKAVFDKLKNIAFAMCMIG